jgi:hypothetical protein
VLQRFLLLPLLTPLLAVLLVGAMNPRPGASLQLLTWRSPAWPVGAWIAAAAAAGAGLSAAGTALALQGSAGPAPSRQVRRSGGSASRQEEWAEPSRPRNQREPDAAAPGNWGGWAGPSRAPADPPPTVSVPFRVIRKAKPAAAPAAASDPGNDRANDNDGWDSASNDDW